MERKLKHLEMIQGVINRLASNSFRIKGWTVILVSALVALLVQEERPVQLAFIALLPVVVFWGLDGYFLSQERRYRRLYDCARKTPECEVDFSMHVSAQRHAKRLRWSCSTFSVTLIPFYLMIIVLVILLIILLPEVTSGAKSVL